MRLAVSGTLQLDARDEAQIRAYQKEAGMDPVEAIRQVAQDVLGRTGFGVTTVIEQR